MGDYTNIVAHHRLERFWDIGENQFVLPDVTVDAYIDSKQWCNNYDIQLEMSYVQQAS